MQFSKTKQILQSSCMRLARTSAVCIFFLALLSCTPATPPVIDYERMIFFESMESTIISKLPRKYAKSTLDYFRGEFKTRLLINVDGRVTKTTFLEGNRKQWMAWNMKIMREFKFNILPKAIPGPWEVDMLVKRDPFKRNEHSSGFITYTGQENRFIPISYRTARQKPDV